LVLAQLKRYLAGEDMQVRCFTLKQIGVEVRMTK